MKTGALVIGLLPALVFAGCTSMFHLEKPTYAVRQIKPHVAVGIPISSSSIDFDIQIDVMNSNSIGVRVDRIELDLSSNDQHLLHAVSDQTTVVPAHGTGALIVKAHVAYAEIRPLFKEIIATIEGSATQYTLVGAIHYHTPFGERQLAVNTTHLR